MSGSEIVSGQRAAYAGFVVFGAFWGAWGASVPAIRDQAGLDDGRLGLALLFVGAGALPAMPAAGLAVDRWGRRPAALLLVLLGAVGTAVALTARDLWSLSAGLALLGAASGAADVAINAAAGAADVAINAAAGAAEQAAGRPVITRAHGFFSASVVLASLSTGLLADAGAPVFLPFLLVTLIAAGLVPVVAAGGRAGAADRAARRGTGAPGERADGDGGPARARPTGEGAPEGRSGRPAVRLAPLLLFGGLGALAFAAENAHQSWGAVYLADVLGAGPVLAAAAPAVFAAVVAVTRFSAGRLASWRAATVLVCGAVTAAAGSAAVAAAPSAPVALAGLVLAAAGTAVLFPTLLAAANDGVGHAVRGRATSVVTGFAYLGFLAGPVYVGWWADATGLPGAMGAVAALSLALALAAWPVLRAVRGPAENKGCTF
ncbi:MFS transporter [Streptosporangium sandarakinum]|uniref:MFS family permease n=1 Tax=Streptosporangium sandarakinum TaxID=1260955 RepID=A0A852UVZ9_9ACTN|nr:MFS transporter [Streptosporangium sandarakinum]NYF39393.1 MFS family permease [Streptosporangium sandarakinum]